MVLYGRHIGVKRDRLFRETEHREAIFKYTTTIILNRSISVVDIHTYKFDFARIAQHN